MGSICVTEPDAERLSVLHRFVRNDVEARLLEVLERKIEAADVLEPERVPADVVTMNSRLRLTDLTSGRSAEYTLVFPSATDARKNRISVLGTLGMSLLGRRVGETVEYRSSAGDEQCRIDAILYQPEAAGDLYG